MLVYPKIDPVAFHIFSWPVHWYGLMYLFGIFSGWLLLSLRNRNSKRGFTQDQISDIIFFSALGIILGGRIGYMFFYEWQTLIHHPLSLLQMWKGGMSFHGGLLGVVVALIWLSKKQQRPFLVLTDFMAPVVPIGLGAGRIGNFINGELWGRITDQPWGMVFPRAGLEPRHPSQIYEFVLEGLVLFIVLWIFSSKPRPKGSVSGLFALLYGIFRFTVEFFRQPDEPIGYFFGWLTEGQLLSVPLIIFGAWLLISAYQKKTIIREHS